MRAARLWLEQDVALDLTEEVETCKLFPTSEDAREVRDKLAAACVGLGVELRAGAAVDAIEPGAAEEGIIGAVIRRDHGVGGASRPPLRVSVNLGCNLVPLMWSRPAFDSRLNLRPSGGSTRTSADFSVPRLAAGVS